MGAFGQPNGRDMAGACQIQERRGFPPWSTAVH